MQAGLGLLGHSPRDFWSMTPRELDAALRGRLGITGEPQSLTHSELTALMGRFPDAGQ
jgi:uncharacterized phage protein (TIGR02216 family)